MNKLNYLIDFGTKLLEKNKLTDQVLTNNNSIEFKVTHNKLQLSKGIYSINVAVRERETKKPFYRINNAYNFQVIHPY